MSKQWQPCPRVNLEVREAVFERVLGQLLRCSSVTDRTVFKPLPTFLQICDAPGLPPTIRAEPIGLLDDAISVWTPAERDELHIDMLGEMVSADDGSTFAWADFKRFDVEAMNRLVRNRAVIAVADEFSSTYNYKVNTSFVLPVLRSTVDAVKLDLHVTRSSMESRNFQDVSKIEMLYHVLDTGFRPETTSATPLKPDGEQIVCIQNLFRSKRYFEVLVQLGSVFARGIPSVSHQVRHVKISGSALSSLYGIDTGFQVRARGRSSCQRGEIVFVGPMWSDV
jgi:hypothetical protein